MDKEIKWVLTAVNVADGTMKELISGSAGLGRPAWLPDGNSFLIAIELQPENRMQLWIVSYPGGENTRFYQRSLGLRQSLEMTQDGKMLVGLEDNESAHIWIAPEGKQRKQNKLPPGKPPTTASRLAPPGNSWCVAAAVTSQLMNADGSERALLRPNLRNYFPCRVAAIAIWCLIPSRTIS